MREATWLMSYLYTLNEVIRNACEAKMQASLQTAISAKARGRGFPLLGYKLL